MMENKKNEESISGYIHTFMEKHVGEKPAAVTAYFQPPFLLIRLEDFLLPGEGLLMETGHENDVLATRSLLIQTLKSDLLVGLQAQTGREMTELYADWNLEKKTGVLIAIMETGSAPVALPGPEEANHELLREIVLLNSMRTQKVPDETNFHWLTDGLLLIERTGILIGIEKKLIENGIIEELRLAKRPLEYEMLDLFNMESKFQNWRHIQELYVDWNFHKDTSYMAVFWETEPIQKE